MKGIYDHDKLCQHKKITIPMNIKIGEMINQVLNGVNPRLLKSVVSQLKREYSEEHKIQLNTEEKRVHVQQVLDRIGCQKYNFAKQNIQEGQKFNAFYLDEQIKLPAQERNFQCVYCKSRFFKTNASLYSHYRSCPQKNKQSQNIENVFRSQRNEGFRPVRLRETKQSQVKAKKVVLVEIIKRENEENAQKDEKQKQRAYKRQKPVSCYSLGSDIFYGDE